MRREHTGNAKATRLAGAITGTPSTFTVVDGTGYPTGAVGPFVVTVGGGTTSEEKILITSRSGNTFTVNTRGYDGTSAADHATNATVEHTWSAVEADEANAHLNDTTLDQHTQYLKKSTATAKGDLFAATGAGAVVRVPVGSDDYVLTASSAAASGVAWGAAAYVKLSNGGSTQTISNGALQVTGGLYATGTGSLPALTVSGVPGQSADPLYVGDQFGALVFSIGPTGQIKLSQAASYGFLGTSVGAAGTASAMPTPAKYLTIKVDGTDYRVALFN